MAQRVYKNWLIETYGGHCTIRRFSCTKDGLYFWRFKLSEAKETIDALESGQEFETIPELYRKSLYN